MVLVDTARCSLWEAYSDETSLSLLRLFPKCVFAKVNFSLKFTNGPQGRLWRYAVSKCPESLTARRQLFPFGLLFLWNVKICLNSHEEVKAKDKLFPERLKNSPVLHVSTLGSCNLWWVMKKPPWPVRTSLPNSSFQFHLICIVYPLQIYFWLAGGKRLSKEGEVI